MNLRPSPSMAVSITALVVALGGTSYAAATIGASDIQRDAVRAQHIKAGAVGGSEVRDGSLRKRDFGANVLDEDGTRWFLVNARGKIKAQSGGFSVEAAYPTLTNTAPAGSPSNALRANGNVYVETNENLGNNGINATISLQNATDQNGDGVMSGRNPNPDANPEFSGEIAVARCGTRFVTCAPDGTNFPEYVVISPRNSDGTATNDSNRKRFYVIITGNSTDFVAP